VRVAQVQTTAQYLVQGLRINFAVNRTEVLDFVRKRLPPGALPSKGGAPDRSYAISVAGPVELNEHRLEVDGWSLDCTGNVEQMLDFLASDLEIFVSVHSKENVFVNAGVVGWRGSALILPGARGQGTTSLVAALLREGAEFYSDRFAVFDADGRVLPYPRPLRLLGDDGIYRDVAPEALGAAIGTEPLDVGLVVVTSYRKDAQWKPQRLADEEIIRALLRCAPASRTRPAEVLSTLKSVIVAASGLEGERGEAAALIADLQQLPTR
jgi:hypothetical protein